MQQPTEENPLGGLHVQHDETTAQIDEPNFKAAMQFKQEFTETKTFEDIVTLFARYDKDTLKLRLNYIFSPVIDFVYNHIVENGVNTIRYLFQLACQKTPGVWTVKFLVDRGADIRCNQDRAVTWAAEQGNLELVRYLMRKGVNVHAYSDLALYKAAAYGHLPVVKYLVGLGANVNNPHNTLYIALNLKHTETADYLIENGAKIYTSEIIEIAAYTGNLPVVKKCLDRPFDSSEQKFDVMTGVLKSAILGKKLDIVYWLFDEGLIVKSYDRLKILYAAVKEGNLDLLKYLVEHGVISDPSYGDLVRQALIRGYVHIAEFLLDKGFEFTLDNVIMFVNSLQGDREKVVRFVIEYNGIVDTDAANIILTYFAGQGELEIVKYLLEPRKVYVDESRFFESGGNLDYHKALLSALHTGKLNVVEYIFNTIYVDLLNKDLAEKAKLVEETKLDEKANAETKLDEKTKIDIALEEEPIDDSDDPDEDEEDEEDNVEAIGRIFDNDLVRGNNPMFADQQTRLTLDYRIKEIICTAVRKSSIDVVKFLVSKISDRQDVIFLGTRAACYRGYVEIFNVLFNMLEKNGDRLIDLETDALIQGNMQILKQITTAIIQLGGKLDLEYMLASAVNRGHLHMIDYLIELGADIDIADYERGIRLHSDITKYDCIPHKKEVREIIEKAAKLQKVNSDLIDIYQKQHLSGSAL